ncbi:hypothetical protein O3P69_001352 [Scylla paramamosain]|uniref:WDR36/Utp21 N-terminal domain-containing protein n=1 Tax=Scylla paramamosain TaxID=85552 RepID=A0AAW0UV61_SCYPA
MAEGSKIFTPYRALGLVSTNIPPVVRYIQRRKENLVVTVVGNTFHTYGAAKLGLLGVGNPHENPIVAVCGDAFHIYTASGNDIYAWRRGTELKHNGKIILHNIKYDETVMELHQDWGKVTGIGFRSDGFPVMVTGSEIGHIAIWNLEEKNLISQIRDAHHGPVLGLKCLLNEPLLMVVPGFSRYEMATQHLHCLQDFMAALVIVFLVQGKIPP